MGVSRRLWIAVLVTLFAAFVLGSAADGQATMSIQPAPGALDPRLMVLTSTDLGRARVTMQRYYKDPDFPSVISYERELEDGRFGGVPVPFVGSEAEIGTSAGSTARFLGQLRTVFASREFRAALADALAEEIDLGFLVSKIQVGRPRSLGVGPGSVDLPMSMRVLGQRLDLHFAVFRVERVLGVLTAVGEPGRRLPLTTMTRMAKVMGSRMTVQLTPRNTVPPTVAGTPMVGQTLTATAGTWTGNPSTFVYAWQRCDATGASCAAIASASGQSYVLQAGDAGSTVRVSVTARNGVASASAVSASTGVVSAEGAPVNVSLPTISGSPTVGQTLTAGTGTWTASPTGFAFQWQRCDSAGASCSPVAGATASTYVVVTGDVSFTLRVVVTATNAAGSASATSAQTAAVS